VDHKSLQVPLFETLNSLEFSNPVDMYKGRDHLESQGIEGRIILRWILRKWDAGVWTGLICHRIGTGGRHLRIRSWAFGIHKMRGIS